MLTNILRMGVKQMGPQSSDAPSNRTRDNVKKLKQKNVHLNEEKILSLEGDRTL